MFSGGLDRHTLETSSAAEIAELRATTYVGADKIDIGKSDHVVDFEGCLGSFLYVYPYVPSRHADRCLGPTHFLVDSNCLLRKGSITSLELSAISSIISCIMKFVRTIRPRSMGHALCVTGQ